MNKAAGDIAALGLVISVLDDHVPTIKDQDTREVLILATSRLQRLKMEIASGHATTTVTDLAALKRSDVPAESSS